jgi:hypothetical protein
MGRGVAQAGSRWTFTAETSVRARVNPCGIFGRQSGTGTVHSPSSLVFPLSIFHRGSPHSYLTWGMNNRSTGGRSSETQSHPFDMNNNVRQSRNLPNFIEPQCSLPCSEQPAPCPDHSTTLPTIHFNTMIPSTSSSLSSGFQSKCYTHLSAPPFVLHVPPSPPSSICPSQ